MPPPASDKNPKGMNMAGSEDEWVDEGEEAYDEDRDIEIDDRDEDEDEGDDDDDALARLSAQYRRFSDARRAMEHCQDGRSDPNGEEEQEEEQDDDDEEEEEEGEDEEEEEEEDDDDDDDEDDDDEDDDDNPLAGALRALTGNVGRRSAGRNGGNSRTLAENMAHIFPEAMGLFGGLNGSTTRISALVDDLARRDDPYLVLETLNELSERLLMMNGILAERGIPSYQLATALVDILNEPALQEQLELQLVACRCLYNFLEVNMDYVHTAVQVGAIEALQAKLFEISYIDLAEQALQTLEFISRVSGTQILKKQCLSSVLQYLDFFTIHAQRKAIATVSNSVKYIRPSDAHILEDVFPVLQRVVIDFTDAQELESAWLAISRIIKNFRNTTHLEKLVTTELLNKIIQVISHSDTSLSTNLKLIASLSICAQNSNLSSEIIKSGKLAESITSTLGKYKKNPDLQVTIESLMAAPKDLLVSVLDLIIYILPSEADSILTKRTKISKDYSAVVNEYKAFVNDIFQLLINIYSSTVLFDVRRRVLICLVRIISSLDNMTDLKEHLSVINLLASIVIQNKSIIRSEKKDIKPYVSLLGSLVLTATLIKKNPEIFMNEFEREGLLADTSSLLEILRQDDANMVDDAVSNDGVDDEIMDQAGDDDKGDDNDDDDDDDVDDEQEHEDDLDQNSDENEDEDYDDYYHGRRYATDNLNIFKEMDVPYILKKLTKLASFIEQIYLSNKASGDSKLEHLRLLDDICGDLNDPSLISSYTYEEWSHIWKSLKTALIKDSYTISSFELISSGIIEVLCVVFNNPEYGSINSPSRSAFSEVFKDDIFETLVKKLQESLTRSESFEIIGCGLKTGENRAASLGKQLKLKLSAADPEDEDDEYDDSGLFEGLNQIVILVHAIASFTNIGTFLKRRVQNPFLFGARSKNTPSKTWSIEFLIGGEVIPPDTTIYGALYKHCQAKNPGFDTNRFWYEIHEIQFRKVDSVQSGTEIEERYPDISDGELENLKHPITLNILHLLKILHDFQNDDAAQSFFLNFKLTAKLNRQLEEPLIVASGILPNWSIHITRKFPFLFPLETRAFFLQSTSFGYSRLIQLWNTKANQDNESNENSDSNGASVSLGRPTRHKVRISRQHLLKSTVKVLEKLGAHPSILEIEFNDEVGTGLGPTLEFYSNVCHAFVEKKYGIWRDDSDDSEKYIRLEKGLFPAPLDPSSSSYASKASMFKTLGKFIARALLDSRILDFNFNPYFFELCARETEGLSVAFDLDHVLAIDKTLYQSLRYLQEHPESVSDMGINFTLPGYDIELVEGGSNQHVDSGNVEQYIRLVVDFTFNKGVKEQIESFVVGFSEVFPYYSMLIFSPKELVELFGNSNEDWSYETLLSSIHADHGYNIDSPTVQNLLRIMASFDLHERRLFLKFLTGAPRLPIGGFKNLRPEFTVVCKHEEDGLKPDDYLPSVMTCANYLKLPDYSSLEVLQERLKRAVEDGADVFLLS